MAEKDYYKILGVDKNASKEDIKKAYKRLAKQYHPDLNKEPNATEKFKEINEAAAALADDEKRARYDKYGTADEQFSGGFSGFDYSDIRGFGFDFDDIFESFFGSSSRGRTRRRQRGADLRYELEIDLEEAAQGVSKEIGIPRREPCGVCDGSGAKSDAGIVTCPDCGGQGMVTRTQRTPFGLFQSTTTCRMCSGEGKYIKEACAACNGSGITRKTRTIDVKIPAGADSGTVLRMSGEGEAAKNGESGDLYIVIRVRPHKVFTRESDDLYIKVPISFATAALGGEVEVPTLDGKAMLKIPAGTQCNTTFRMRGKGMPHLNGYGAGDQHVEVVIEVPEKLSKKQHELLEEFERGSEKKKRSFW